MNTIAIMTLIFLPSSLVAAMFGSAFFDFDVAEDGAAAVRFSSLFWVFWVVSIPLTVLVFGGWLWRRRKVDRMMRFKVARQDSIANPAVIP